MPETYLGPASIGVGQDYLYAKGERVCARGGGLGHDRGLALSELRDLEGARDDLENARALGRVAPAIQKALQRLR